MSVNSQVLAACTCPTAHARSYSIYDVNCSLGADLLAGTGFQTGELVGHSHGGAGWLTASLPVTAGSTITVTALIYDSGDGTYDSLALLPDNEPKHVENPKDYAVSACSQPS